MIIWQENEFKPPVTSADHSKAMVLLLLIHCLLLPLSFYRGLMLSPCLVVHYLVSFRVLQSSP